MEGWAWIKKHIEIRFILTPLGTINSNYHTGGGGIIGYTDYYIFGIRLARIQKTAPWD